MRILIVEGDRISALMLRTVLENQGHEVAEARNGKEGWERFCSAEFRLVISDWFMPEMDGLELCRRIRGLADEKYTYILLLTPKGQCPDQMEGIAAGADDFLVEPVNPGELIARLDVAYRLISTHEKLEQAVTYLEFATKRFERLFQGLPIACFTYDKDGRLREWNPMCEQIFGLRFDSMLEMRLKESLLRHVKESQLNEELISCAAEGYLLQEREWIYPHPNGTERHISTSAIPLALEGELLGAVCASLDVTQRREYEHAIEEYILQTNEMMALSEAQNAQLAEANTALAAANAQLADMATTDSLTGLKNHRAFQERLQEELHRAVRSKNDLALILLDVDRFKQYNDDFGHPAGDEILKTVAGLLQQTARQSDMVARYGGEEFVMILFDTDRSGAMLTGERIRVQLESHLWPKRPVTVSIGVASLSKRDVDRATLIAEADNALYASKRAGRNRVTHADCLSDPEENPDTGA